MKVEHRRQESSTECGIIPQDRLRDASVLLVVNNLGETWSLIKSGCSSMRKVEKSPIMAVAKCMS
jgi:hypothetical protein